MTGGENGAITSNGIGFVKSIFSDSGTFLIFISTLAAYLLCEAGYSLGANTPDALVTTATDCNNAAVLTPPAITGLAEGATGTTLPGTLAAYLPAYFGEEADFATSPLRLGLTAELLPKAGGLDDLVLEVFAALLDAFAYLPSYLGLALSPIDADLAVVEALADFADVLDVEEVLPVPVPSEFDALSFFADALLYLPTYLGLTSSAFEASDLLADLFGLPFASDEPFALA